jgi:hypothetical protein
MRDNHISRERLHQLFRYHDGNLYRHGSDRPIGSTRKDKYRVTSVDGRLYLVHRLVWLFHNGELPPVIDHIDCDPSNNRIENLRPLDRSRNGLNRKHPKKNSKTQVLGVYYDKSRDKYGAEIRIDGIKRHLGRFATAQEAHAAYIKARAAAF